MKAYGVNGDIAPFILSLGTRYRKVVSFTSYPIYPQVKISRCPMDRRVVGPHCLSEIGSWRTPQVNSNQCRV